MIDLNGLVAKYKAMKEEDKQDTAVKPQSVHTEVLADKADKSKDEPLKCPEMANTGSDGHVKQMRSESDAVVKPQNVHTDVLGDKADKSKGEPLKCPEMANTGSDGHVKRKRMTIKDAVEKYLPYVSEISRLDIEMQMQIGRETGLSENEIYKEAMETIKLDLLANQSL